MILFFFKCYGDHRDLHSFPTRRSSDLGSSVRPSAPSTSGTIRSTCTRRTTTRSPRARGPRSEEHTSELQSHLNLVCRLLLEKKKKKNIILRYRHIIARVS